MEHLSFGVVAIILLLLTPVIVTPFLYHRLKTRRAAEVLAHFDGRELLGVTDRANFFGQQSRGLVQLRGNGILALTRTELYFRMLAGKFTYTIPVTHIRDIETPRSFKGRSILKPLLKVVFDDENGREDSLAWYVPELPRWVEALNALKQQATQR